MQVNMTAAQLTAVMQNTGLTGQNASPMAFSGGFMELLMQLLNHTETGDPSQMLLELFGTNAGGPEGLLLQGLSEEEDLSQEQQQNAMELLAVMLQQADPRTAQLPAETAYTVPQDVLSGSQPTVFGAWTAEQDRPATQKNQEETAADTLIPFTVETAASVKDAPEKTVSADALLLQGRFQSAVQKAKAMNEEADAPAEQAMDIQMLEDRVQAAQKNEMAQGGSPPLDTKDLAKQLTQSVPKALQDGKSEFTLKLKPEGMGEITVRLTQEAGKTAVTIAAALPQTEKLIGAQLGVLEKALEPMGVTIRQEPMEQLAAQQQSMTDENRQFMLWQQNQQQRQPGRGWQAQSEGLEEVFMGESAPAAMLDAYI